MAHTLASLIVAGVMVSAGSHAITSAQATLYPAAEVEILVNGAPQRRYAHHGRLYMEALKGHEYAVRLRNPYPVRVGVALSVDGLNTIDARHTSAPNARKWVLGPYETVTISGWQTSRTDARRFEFTTEAESYAPGPRKDREPRGDLGRLLQGARRQIHERIVTRHDHPQRAGGTARGRRGRCTARGSSDGAATR